ncbi:DUF2853 family protein [Snuella sedimenti]|uniref:DUF2853 family protein n=1 Tax=Snuella sedimenti TaxID=2798802 RepID=A0A8J7JCY0_9FLAO|nr:DUF2853 family protein [Snuella sedimenti]MBJ6368644.1 DUF2853 family protein [Snuella sedimenti]
MNKRDELIAKYAVELRDRFNVDVDMELLTKITVGCGPSIYNADSSTVSSSDESELDRVKTNFLIKKLGLNDNEDLDRAIVSVMENYGKTNRSKYRVVVYYLLTKHFSKESVY